MPQSAWKRTAGGCVYLWIEQDCETVKPSGGDVLGPTAAARDALTRAQRLAAAGNPEAERLVEFFRMALEELHRSDQLIQTAEQAAA